MDDTRRIPPASLAVGTGWDVSSHLSVPSDLLKRATRERKYVIERIEKCSRDTSATKERMLEVLVEARKDLERIGKLERQALRMARARVEYSISHLFLSHRYDEEMKLRRNGMDAHAHSQRIDDLTYVDILIQDYVARHGYKDTLACMERREIHLNGFHTSDLVDSTLYEELNQLVESLEKKMDCSKALEWCKVHRSKLKKVQSSLMFQLHVQEFVQILRLGGNTRGNKAKAIAYAKAHLSPYATTYPDDFQRAASLLVLQDILPGSPTCLTFFNENRWHDLVSQLRREFLTLHGVALTSPLETYLKAGISSLKTPEGMKDYNDYLMDSTRRINISASRDNPLRHPSIHRMAISLPYAKRTVSKLVCPVTGMIMEGANAPMVLPNGYVYGNLAFEGGYLDCNNDGQAGNETELVKCPCTGDIFRRANIRRAYIV